MRITIKNMGNTKKNTSDGQNSSETTVDNIIFIDGLSMIINPFVILLLVNIIKGYRSSIIIDNLFLR